MLVKSDWEVSAVFRCDEVRWDERKELLIPAILYTMEKTREADDLTFQNKF